jgi:hypothetical protein
MLTAGDQLRVYSDNAQLKGELSTVKLGKDGEVQLSVPCNGGALIVK